MSAFFYAARRHPETRPAPADPLPAEPAVPVLADLVILYHHLHDISMQLVTAPPAGYWDRIGDLRAGVETISDPLGSIAPGALSTLRQLEQVTDLGILCSELAEAHRLLGHGLRDHGIDPGKPSTSVGHLLGGNEAFFASTRRLLDVDSDQ